MHSKSQRRCKIGNCVRTHGVVAAVPGSFKRFSSAPEDGRHHTADLAAPLSKSLRTSITIDQSHRLLMMRPFYDEDYCDTRS